MSSIATRRFRRPRSLAASFTAGEDLYVYNYLKNVKVELDLVGFELLHRCGEWKTIDELLRELGDWKRAELKAALEALFENQLLVTEDDEYDRGLDAWSRWEDDARFFHFWNRHAFARKNPDAMKQAKDGRWIQLSSTVSHGGELRQEASPPPFKRYPAAPRVYLPRAFLPLARSCEETLIARRTARNFTRAPITLRELSTILHFTFAPMLMKDDGDFGILQVRTSASGGSRHEAECYVGVLAVEGLPSGLYHYCGVEHSLELLRREFTPEMAVSAAAEQAWLSEAACVCFVSAVFERMSWKYRFSSAYKVILMNAGFLGQTFALTTTALGLDVFQTAAIDSALVESWLGLDPAAEGLTLMTACGHVRDEDRHLVEPPMMQPTTIPLVRDHELPSDVKAPTGAR